MNRSMFSVFFILLLMSPLVSGGQPIELSPWWTDTNSGFFFRQGHFPEVVTNDFQKEWLVAWVESAKVKGRIVKPDGQLGSIKTLVKATADYSDSLFGVVFDPIHHTYLILYRDGKNRLMVQLLSSSLGRIGSSHLVRDPNAIGIFVAQLVFDPVVQKYFVFWIENDIKSIALDADGIASSKITTILDAGNSIYYNLLRVARNPQNGNLFLEISQFSNGVSSILGYTLNSNRTLLRTEPVTFAAKGAFSIPDAEFGPGGTGIATWATQKDEFTPLTIRIRKIKSGGTFGFKTKFIPEEEFVTLWSSLVLDPARERVLVLREGREVTGALLDQNTEDVLKDPITFARPLYFGGVAAYASGVNGAYEGSSGKILIVWATECSNPDSLCPGSTRDASQVNGFIFTSK